MPPAQHASTGDSGFALIEVLVSALVVVIVGGAVLTLLQTTARSAGDERHHATAFALAQEDQSRLRTSRLSSLNNLQETRNLSVDGYQYTVESKGVFVNSGTGNASCTEGYESADYARVTSIVTWPGLGSRPPVKIASIVAPSSGSLDPTHGTLTLSVTNAAGVPLSGVSISGTGPGTFSGSSDESGCASFTDLPEGNYTMTTSANGLVDENGDAIGVRTVGVIASGTQTVVLRYDNPGEATVQFQNRVEGTAGFEAAKIDSLYLYHPEMTGSGKFVGEPGGTRTSLIETGPLFPFTSPYTVYAGSCASNNPNPSEEEGAPGAEAMAGITIPAGEALAPVLLKVPALYVTVEDGSTPLQNAEVVISDDECKNGGSYVERKYTTNASGRHIGVASGEAEPALPWGRYNVCAAAYTSGRYRRQHAYNVDVKNLSDGTYATLNLTGSGSESSGWKELSC